VIVVEASVLIAHLDERDALHSRAGEALDRSTSEPLGCSPITLAEVLVGPARALLAAQDSAAAAILNFDDALARVAKRLPSQTEPVAGPHLWRSGVCLGSVAP
jgi:predicted nucleic acid-binding protein